jgi:protein-S-isoprenylcysteine O-methyltransferase
VRLADDDGAARRVLTPMAMPPGSMLGLFYGLSEVGLTIFKRAKSTAAGADQGSIRMLWIVIVLSITASQLAIGQAPVFRSRALVDLRPLWVAVCIAGIAIRWWAIIHLGRFFTVNVAIAADHHVVDDGPYRFVRHPSYTGALMSFIGYGLFTGNWLAFVLLAVPVTAAFLYRMSIEERALRSGLGEPYQAYAARTKRLLPFLY